MDVNSLMPHVEALIFASDKPLTDQELVDFLNQTIAKNDGQKNHDIIITKRC